MVDRVQPLKLEDPDSGGSQTDQSPKSLDHNRNFLDARGLAIQSATSDDSNVLVSRDGSGNLTFVDGVTPSRKLAELLVAEGHRLLGQLSHDQPDRDYFEEYTYEGVLVANITIWATSAKLLKVREYQYSYATGKVSQEVAIQYDAAGVESERLTMTYNYTGSKVSSVSCVRS